MAKRIFKVIGIVLASILGFTGAVVGVMAIMGKFKKPVVYPKQLVFAETEKIIVDNYSYTDGYSDKIYSFVLTGIGEEEKEVTMKDCLLTINYGSNLIQICNENGENVVAESNGKYKIRCNENTYFKLKKVEDKIFDSTTYGKVSLRADDEKMMTGTARDQDMVIWIDRAVKALEIKDDQVSNENKKDLIENGSVVGKEITLGLDEELAFDVVSSPKYALNPISKAEYGKKIVEYFYFKQGVTDGWQMIDKTNLEGFSFLAYDEETDRLTFKANSTAMAGQSYMFKIAVFDTYAHRQEFLAGLEGNQNPTSNLDRLAEMVTTQLKINVKSTKITNIGSETANIDISLFEGNNNIILNAEKEGYKNLQLYMIGAGARTSLRFDEADFDLRTINLINNAEVEEYNFKKYTSADFSADATKKLNLNSIVGNTFIDFFVYNDQFGSENYQTYRLATKAEFDYEAKYIKDSYGNERAFNIIAKSLPTISSGKLVLGVMVVNSTGEYYLTTIDVNVAEMDLNFNFTKENQTYTLDVDFEGEDNSNLPIYGKLKFEDIVNISAGSYRGGVFITPKLNDGAKYNVRVCENIKFVKDDQTYVLVGYFEDGKFVNVVQANEGANNLDTALYMLQLKNAFEHQNSTNVAEQYINSVIKNNILGDYVLDFNNEGADNIILVNKDYISIGRKIVVKIRYNISAAVNFLEFASDNTTDGIVENGTDQSVLVGGFNYSVKLSSDVPDMLKKIFDAEGEESFRNHFSVLTYDKNNALTSSDNMLTIGDVKLSNDEGNEGKYVIVNLSINESADSSANNANIYKIQFKYGAITKESKFIFAKSNKPTNINLTYMEGEGEQANRVDIELNKASLHVSIAGVQDSNYIYNYVLKYTLPNEDVEKSYTYTLEEGNNFVLNNAQVDTLTKRPIFTLTPNYNANNTLTYSINGTEIKDNLTGLAVGEYDLIITTTGNLSKTLKVFVDSVVNPEDVTSVDGYFAYNTPKENNILSIEAKDKNQFSLNAGSEGVAGVDYKFVNKTTGDSTQISNLVNISNIRFTFAGSETLKLVENKDENDNIVGYQLQTNADLPVLTIERIDGDWTFVRNNYLNTRLVVTLSVKMDTIATAFDVQIAFTSSRQVDLNRNWTDIYGDTTIKFAESINGDVFNTNALFKIKLTSSETLTYNIYKQSSDGKYPTNATKTEADFVDGQGSLEVGNYKVDFLIGTEILATFNNLQVKPNAIVNLKTDYNLKSETEHDLSTVFALHQFDTTKAYGSDLTSSIVYKNTDLVELTNTANFAIECNQKDDSAEQNALISFVDGKLSVGFVKDLGQTKQCEFKLKYDGIVLGEFVVNIVNKYEVIDTSIVEGKQTQFMVNKDAVTDGLTIKFGEHQIAPSNVTINGYNLVDFKVENNISSTVEVLATYTFDNKYVYTKTIVLMPYIPTTKSGTNTTKTHSQNDAFDIVNDVFNFGYTQGKINDKNIKNIYIESIKVNDVENNTIITTQSGDNAVGVGYQSSINVTEFLVKIGAIAGSKLNAVIVYHIDYTDGASYNYTHTLNIENYLALNRQYPFADIQTSSELNLKALDGKTNDVLAYAENEFGDETNNKLTIKNNNVFGFAMGLKYEPITMGQKIGFNADDVMNIRRMLVLNGTTIVDDSITKVELVAYQSIQSAKTYIDSGSIIIGRNSITFNNSSTFTGSSVYLLFKITTSSNNFGYYLVRLQKQSGNFAGLDLTAGSFDKIGEAVDGKIDIVPTKSEIENNSGVTIDDESKLHYYLMSVKNSDNNTTDSFVDGVVASGRYAEIIAENQSIDVPSGFVQIVVATVYIDNNKAIYLGSCTINIATETGLNIYDESTQTGLLHKTSTLGRYSATLNGLNDFNIIKTGEGAHSTSANIEGISGVSGYFKLVEQDIVSSNGNKTIVTLNGSKITTVLFASEKLTFTVKYKVNNSYSIYVDFVYDGVQIDAVADAIVGTFDKETGFNTSVDLTNTISSYAGTLAATADGEVAEIYENKINFVQSNATTNKNIILSFDDLIDLTTGETLVREFKVTIYPAYYIEQTMGTQSTPFVVKDKSNNFESVIGSSAQFALSTKENATGETLYISYQIDGLTIYVASGSYLSLTSQPENNKYSYIVKDADATENILLGNESLSIGRDNAQTSINFVHMAQSKTIKMEIGIKIKADAGEDVSIYDKNGNKALVVDFYVTLPVTYSNLKPNYSVAGSNHDNFVAKANQQNILAYLFGSNANIENVTNAKRMDLITGFDANTGKDVVAATFNATKMGFYDESNPNCLAFVLGDGLKIDKVVDQDTGVVDYTMTFDNVMSQTSTWFRLTNVAGLESETYNIEILTEAKDKLIYKADDSQTNYLDNHSTWVNDGANQFASIVINDVEIGSTYDYSTISSKNVIAKIYDVRNNVFKVVNNGNVMFNNNADSSAKIAFNNEDNTYSLTTHDYTITFWSNNSGEILFNIERAQNSAVCSSVAIPLTIYTNAGKVCDFTFNIFNFSSIKSSETEYYATETFKLSDLLKISSATKAEGEENFTDVTSNYKFDLDLKNCSYFVAGNKYTLTDEDSSNSLFSYDAINRTITLEQVPEDVQLTACIKIMKDTTLVDVVQRVITIKRNIEFLIDGNHAAAGSQLETNYDFANTANSSITGNKAVLTPKSLTNSTTAGGFGLTLNFVKNSSPITINKNNTKIAISQVEIADFMGNNATDYVELNQETYTLTFKRDFTGDVTLSLGFKTNFGYFYQYLTIHATGLQSFSYRYAPTSALLNAGSSFYSGNYVNIVSQSSSNNPAIVATNREIANLRYDISLGYKVCTYEEYASLNIEKLQGLTYSAIEGHLGQSNVLISEALPLVPQSKIDNPIDYYVVYKIVYDYVQGAENQPLFAIYKVRNVATINVAPNVETTINVDDSGSQIYNASSNLLNLFYYKETFTKDSLSVAIIYLGQNSEGKDQFKIGETIVTSASTASLAVNEFAIENGSILKANVDGSIYEFDFAKSVPTLKVGELEYTRTQVENYAKTMFVCDYSNILRFKDFVDNLNYIEINNRQFKSLVNTNGLFAINLKEFDKSTGKTVLFENTTETSLAIYAQNSSVALTSVDLILTGKNTIEEKGKFNLSQIFQDGSYVSDYSIVGITSNLPNVNWVSKATSCQVVKNEGADVVISTFTVGEKTYTVKQATFIGGGVSGLYQVSQNYYYLVSTGETSICVVDYLPYGNSFYFRVQYTEGNDSSIDLKDAIKCFANDASGKLTATPMTLDSISAEVSTDGTIVSVGETILNEYKQNNPTKTTMDIDVTLTSGSISLIAKIRFELPTTV